MAQEIDATIRLAMDQGFAGAHQSLVQAGVRHNNDMNFVTATVQLQHELNRQLVGAKAAGNLDMDRLAKATLDQRGVRDQPDHKAA